MTTKKLFLWVLLISCVIAACILASSCNVSKHVQSSETKKDSSISTSTKTNTESTQNSGSKSEDKYESKTITTYIYDTVTKQFVINNVVTERKGTLIIQDTQVIHVNEKVFDTSHIQVVQDDSKYEKQKTVTTSFKTYLLIGLALFIIALAVWVYRKFVKK